MSAVDHRQIELGVFQIFREFLAQLLHGVVLGVISPVYGDIGAGFRGFLQLVENAQNDLGARRVELDQLEIEFD